MESWPSAQEISEYDDEQLDKYLEDNGRIVRVTDPHNLPASFIQRLRDRCDPETQPGASASQPVDMDAVAAKLMQTMTKRGRRRIPSPVSAELLSPVSRLEKLVQWEEEAYDKLVEKGGRPLYDIEMLRTVSENPDAYTDLLQPLIDQNGKKFDDWWCVFSNQENSWTYFRARQEMARKTQAALDAQNKLAASNRAMLGITRPFVFIMDTDKQDKLTTWMEYLEHQCSLYKQHGGQLQYYAQRPQASMAKQIKWIMDQMPAIEKEMAEEAEAAAKEGTTNGAVAESSSSVIETTEAEEQPPASSQPAPSSRKRRRDDNTEASGVSTQKSAESDGPEPKRSRVGNLHKTSPAQTRLQSTPPSSPPAVAQQATPRRSARLAGKATPESARVTAAPKKTPRAKAKSGAKETKKAAGSSKKGSSKKSVAAKPQKMASALKSKKRR